jgi:hypothetical protein
MSLGSDLSLGARLFLTGDASFGSTLTTAAFVTSGADISLNGELYVGKDASFGGNLIAGGLLTLPNDLSLNGNLVLDGDASIYGNIGFSGPLTLGLGNLSPLVPISSSTSPVTLDYSQGSYFYLSTPPSANFTVNLINVPTISTKNLTVTIYINSAANDAFANVVTINGAASTPVYNGGIPTITGATVIMQRLLVINGATDVLSTVVPYA